MTDRAAINLMRKIIESHRNNPKWDEAPLGKIKSLSNTTVGTIGQEFVRAWSLRHNLSWEGPPSVQSPWDARIEGIEFEIKTATEDLRGKFQFNHIRHHRQYQAVLCVGISPSRVHFDAWRKGEISEGKAGKLVSMDKGSSATFKLTRSADDMRQLSEFPGHIKSLAKR